MRRRDLLGVGAMGGLLGLAGCRELIDRTGLTEDPTAEPAEETPTPTSSPTRTQTPSGPASFTRPELVVQDQAQAGTTTTVTVRTRNAGGERGDLTGTLTATHGGATIEKPFTIRSVRPRETGTAEVVVVFDRVGTYELRVEGEPLQEPGTAQISAGNLVRPVGNPIRVSEAVRATVSGFRYRNLITYSADLGLGYDEPAVTFVRPPDGEIQALAQIRFENLGLEEFTPQSLGWTLPSGEFYEKYPETLRSGYQPRGVRTTQHTEGESLFYGWVESASEKQLFAPFTIDRETAASDLRLEIQRGGADTPVEYAWTDDTKGVPDLRLRRFGPEGDEISRSATYPVVVENVGSAPVDLQLVIQHRPEGRTQYPTPVGATYFERGLQPGATTTWSVTDHPDALGTYDVRVVPFDEETEAATRRFTYTPPTVALGDQADLGVGTMTVSDLRLADGYEQEEPTLTQGQAPNGTQYLLFFVSFVASRDVSSVPADGFYGTVAGERRYSEDRKLRKPDSESSELQPPVSFDPSASLATGERERGWVGILVPEEATRADIARVGYRGQVEHGDRGANWTV